MPTPIMYEDAALRTAVTVGTATPLPVSLGGNVSVGAGSLGKAEDAVAASGDVGIATLGVRAPVTPVAATSNEGDYGQIQLDAEGRQTTKLNSVSENTFQFSGSTIVATDVLARAAAAAGIRNYVTDICVSNSAVAGFVFALKDGAAVIFQTWVAPGQSVNTDLLTPLRGTAATALNFSVTPATSTAYVNVAGFIGI